MILKLVVLVALILAMFSTAVSVAYLQDRPALLAASKVPTPPPPITTTDTQQVSPTVCLKLSGKETCIQP